MTPRARRLAAELGVDVSAVTGSGAGGAVLGEDLVGGGHLPGAPASAAASGGPESDGSAHAPETRGITTARTGADAKAAMRTAIANLMSRSNAEIPHYYVAHTMDLEAAFAWLAEHNADLPPAQRVLPAALFLRATVLAAQAVPDLNAHWVDEQLRRSERVDVGVAVATRGGGLVTPAIVAAGELGIDELMAAFKDLVHRARRGSLRQSEMAGASITMSSVGESGPDTLVGVIFPPQVALVGVGGVAQRPWAVRGMLTVRPTVTITLAADHRATDGRTAAAFISRFDRALQNPEEL